MQETIIKYGLKFGPWAVVAIYLVYFLVNTVSGQLTKIIELEEHSTMIHSDMLTVLKDIRDEKVSRTVSDVHTAENAIRFQGN